MVPRVFRVFSPISHYRDRPSAWVVNIPLCFSVADEGAVLAAQKTEESRSFALAVVSRRMQPCQRPGAAAIRLSLQNGRCQLFVLYEILGAKEVHRVARIRQRLRRP